MGLRSGGGVMPLETGVRRHYLAPSYLDATQDGLKTACRREVQYSTAQHGR